MNYVESPNGQQSPPPYFFPSVSINACILEATRSNLQAWCDTYLNIGYYHRYKPLVPFVYAAISHYPKMFSVGLENLGYVSQNEYLFMFPMVHYENMWNLWVPVGLTWAFPFIGVDNGTSAISGETVIGLPKTVGTITRATAGDGSFSARVAMPGFADFTATTKQELLPIFAMRTSAPAIASINPSTIPGAATNAAGLSFPWLLLGDTTTIEDALIQLLDDLFPGAYSSTTLKQIRDGEDRTKACFQSLLTAEWQMQDLAAPIEFGSGEVDIVDFASIAIIKTLGLVGGRPSANPLSHPATGTPLRAETFRAIAAFELQADMNFGNLRNLEI